MCDFTFSDDEILAFFLSFKKEYRTHALERMLERRIDFEDIDQISDRLEILEYYPKDQPYPSCLAMGYTDNGRPIHIVFSVNNMKQVVYIITVYEPDRNKWEKDFKRRKM